MKQPKRMNERWLDNRLEFIARKVLISSAAYYSLDVSLYDDTEFDLWLRELSDNWDKLCENTQWKLVSPEAIRASGFHVRLRERDMASLVEALRHYGHLKNCSHQDQPIWATRKIHPEYGFKYTTASDFGWS